MFEQSHVGSYVDRDGTHLATRLLNIWEPSCGLVFMLQVGRIKFHFVTFGQVMMGELNFFKHEEFSFSVVYLIKKIPSIK